MRPVAVVVAFPLFQLASDVDVVDVANKLRELFRVGFMAALHLAIQMRGTWLDIDVGHPKILAVPVEFSLVFVAVVDLYRVNPEGRCPADMINKVNGVGLRVAVVYAQNTGPGRIVDCRELVAPDFPAALVKGQELHVDLNAAPGHALFMALEGFHSAGPLSFRQNVHPVAHQDLVDAAGGSLHVEIAFQRPGYPRRTEVVFPAQVEDLGFNGLRHSKLGVLRAGFRIHQARVAARRVAFTPVTEGFRADAEVPAGLSDVADFLSIGKYALLARDVPQSFFVHAGSSFGRQTD